MAGKILAEIIAQLILLMTALIVFLLVVVVFTIAVMLYMRRAVFGRSASGVRLERIRRSPNFRDGKFQNLHLTPSLTEGANILSVMREFFFKRNPQRKPLRPIPGIKTNLLQLDRNDDILVWFGHSSYFLQADGKTFLNDPVFSGNASPIRGGNKAFAGSDLYSADEMPGIDYMIITHDHYDHLDYDTVKKMQAKVGKVICGLGVGAHLERWGFAEEVIVEMDWNETIELGDGCLLHGLPARHFSGRNFSRNTTLWLSFLLQTPALKIYLGGDSGYDDHFKMIGEKFGPIDLAILDNGQYDRNWKYIHMHPPQVLQAAEDLQAKRFLPLHSSKFALSNHPWKEPLTRVAQLAAEKNMKLLTPMIGEPVLLRDETQGFTKWWEEID